MIKVDGHRKMVAGEALAMSYLGVDASTQAELRVNMKHGSNSLGKKS